MAGAGAADVKGRAVAGQACEAISAWASGAWLAEMLFTVPVAECESVALAAGAAPAVAAFSLVPRLVAASAPQAARVTSVASTPALIIRFMLVLASRPTQFAPAGPSVMLGSRRRALRVDLPHSARGAGRRAASAAQTLDQYRKSVG